jgi:hypothetical protein
VRRGARIALGAGAAGLALALPALPAPALELDPASLSPTPSPPPPATPVFSAPQRDLIAGFDTAVDPASLTAQTWTVREVEGDGALGPPLPGGNVLAADATGTSWDERFPSDFGSNATYRVTMTGVRPAGGTDEHTFDSWTFRTGADSRAPAGLSSLTAARTAGGVALQWAGPVDFDRAGVTLLRRAGTAAPALGDPATTVVGSYDTDQTGVLDTAAPAGTVLTYAVIAFDRDPTPNRSAPFVAPPLAPLAGQSAPDAAGSGGLTGTTSTPVTNLPPANTRASRRHLLIPRRARLAARHAAPVRWRRDPRATYYNVQLLRGRRKLVSTFPTGTRTILPKRALARPGTYRLLVWSGRGPKRVVRYARTPWVNQNIRVG